MLVVIKETLKRFLRVFLIISLILSIPYKRINPDLKQYNDQFQDLLKLNCKKNLNRFKRQIIITFMELRYPTVGLCIHGVTNIMIFIDPVAWNKYPEMERYQLFMHEATHCYLGLTHKQDVLHYMNSFLVPLSYEDVNNQLVDSIKEVCK